MIVVKYKFLVLFCLFAFTPQISGRSWALFKFLRKFTVIWIWEALDFTHGKACGCPQFLLTVAPHSVIVFSVHKGTTTLVMPN